ncbi:hypothetical protein Tco_1263019 [Tanacetum coccineum]
MEEYIRLEEEKAQKRGKVYNWETATYGKIWYDEDVHDLRSIETEFQAIVFNDSMIFEETPSCEPTVSPLNDNKIDFRISFDESDDEDYTVIYEKNSFSYKIISVNDLKSDSENDNDKVNMPSFPSPEPTDVPSQYGVSWGMETTVSTSFIFYGIHFEFKAANTLRRFALVFLILHKPSKMKNDEGFVMYQSSGILCVIVKIDNPNITMEEYIRLEEEKAHRHSKVYNWETTTYGKIWDNEDVHGLRSVETEFPAISFNDTLTFEETLSCEPMVSSLNDEIDFRISFEESDDEDCTIIFDKIHFPTK